jgi:hypothetical protein
MEELNLSVRFRGTHHTQTIADGTEQATAPFILESEFEV